MFSSKNRLKRRTPEQGIDRQQFIEHLVEEYYATFNVEAQEQVTANLANFAYDPINWEYLKISEVLKLFVELLVTPNEKLQLHGISGLCNICLDCQAYKFIIKAQNIKIIKDLLLKSKNVNIILNVLTLFYQLLSQSQSIKTSVLCAKSLKQIKKFETLYQNVKQIVNITSLLLEEFGTRYEIVEINTNLPLNTQMLK